MTEHTDAIITAELRVLDIDIHASDGLVDIGAVIRIRIRRAGIDIDETIVTRRSQAGFLHRYLAAAELDDALIRERRSGDLHRVVRRCRPAIRCAIDSLIGIHRIDGEVFVVRRAENRILQLDRLTIGHDSAIGREIHLVHREIACLIDGANDKSIRIIIRQRHILGCRNADNTVRAVRMICRRAYFEFCIGKVDIGANKRCVLIRMKRRIADGKIRRIRTRDGIAFILVAAACNDFQITSCQIRAIRHIDFATDECHGIGRQVRAICHINLTADECHGIIRAHRRVLDGEGIGIRVIRQASLIVIIRKGKLLACHKEDIICRFHVFDAIQCDAGSLYVDIPAGYYATSRDLDRIERIRR